MKTIFLFNPSLILHQTESNGVLNEFGKCLRIFKHSLYAEYFNKYSTLAELKANPDSRTDPNQWGKLSAQWQI